MDTLLANKSTDNTGFLNQMYFGNPIQDYLIAIAIVLLGVTITFIARKIVTNRLSNINSSYSAYFLKIDYFIYPIIYLLVIYGAFIWLAVPTRASKFLHYAFTVGFIFLSVRLITASIRTAIQTYLIQQDETGEKLKEVKGIVLILNGVLWIIGLIFLFDNLGFNVTAILTGLGVGGIAIALAAQTILGDIFNYFVIFFDRPFEVGDFIKVGEVAGTVEYTGLKTTRIKSISGEQVVFTNSNITNSTIQNFKHLTERRVLFKFGVIYEVGRQKLAMVPSIVRTIIEKQPDARFDRAHFASFGNYSLDFEVVYFVLGPDYTKYMDIQEQINLLLYEEFKKTGIEFAYPTYMVNMNATEDK